MKKKAIIFGISGQDGSYLAELLLEKDYEVFGLIRRHSVSENQDTRINHLSGIISTSYGDVLDENSVIKLIKSVDPDEVYNLAAQSQVGVSFEVPKFTLQVNGIGAFNIFEACRRYAYKARVYMAASSEMFGNNIDSDGYQRETTKMDPVSPYGCAKLMAYHIAKHYRRTYKMFISNGILMNHESPRRGSNFVTQKVVKTAVEIKYGLKDKLILGNLDSKRDWSHAKDMVRAMHMILQHHEPGDFLASSMETHSIRDMCDYVFKKLDMNYQDYVAQDDKFLRPEELDYLCGDSTKIRETFGWQPEYDFESLMDEMIDHWMEKLANTHCLEIKP